MAKTQTATVRTSAKSDRTASKRQRVGKKGRQSDTAAQAALKAIEAAGLKLSEHKGADSTPLPVVQGIGAERSGGLTAERAVELATAQSERRVARQAARAKRGTKYTPAKHIVWRMLNPRTAADFANADRAALLAAVVKANGPDTIGEHTLSMWLSKWATAKRFGGPNDDFGPGASLPKCAKR